MDLPETEETVPETVSALGALKDVGYQLGSTLLIIAVLITAFILAVMCLGGLAQAVSWFDRMVPAAVRVYGIFGVALLWVVYKSVDFSPLFKIGKRA
jgi:hypothetical protein